MTTYYARKSGDDGNDGLSPSTAWLTIGKANSAGAGSIIYVGAGDYSTEEINPTSDSMSFYGDYKGIYTGDAGEILINGILVGDTADRNNILIDGFDCIGSVTGHLRYSAYFRNYTGNAGHNFTLNACKLKYVLTMISPRESIIVTNNVINYSKTERYGASITPYYHQPPTYHTYLYVYNNTIYSTGSSIDSYALYIVSNDGNAPCYVKNNILIQLSALYGHCLRWGGNNAKFAVFVSDYNFFQAGRSNYVVHYYNGNLTPTDYDLSLLQWQALGEDVNSLEGDPLIKTDNIHLQDNSPCVDVGTNTGVADDIDGQSRPFGIAYDIGADEAYKIQQIILSDTNTEVREQQIILSDAYMFWKVSSGDSFSFGRVSQPVSSFSLKTKDETKTIMLDAKLQHLCNHYLSGIQHTLDTCSRCLGKGYYFDIKFDAAGDIITIDRKEKLLQELVKITLTSKGTNSFHKEYGTSIFDNIGLLLEDDFQKTKLKQAIIETVLRLKYLQRDYIGQGYKLSLEELIDRIYEIEIYEIDGNPTTLGFKVQIITIRGETILLQGSVIL